MGTLQGQIKGHRRRGKVKIGSLVGWHLVPRRCRDERKEEDKGQGI